MKSEGNTNCNHPGRVQRVARKGGLVALIGASAAVVLTPMVAYWEGKRNEPYRDIVGVLTVCYGDTNNIQRRRYSDAECIARLETQLVEHAKPVLRCTPTLRAHPNALAAAISLTYNIGGSAYCRSTVARHFNRGDIRRGCDNFLSWNKGRVNGSLRTIRGLDNRRRAERDICLRDAAPLAGNTRP